MSKYIALSNLHHDGKAFAPGKPVTIDDDEQAQVLLDLGVIEPAKEDKPAKAPGK